MKKITQKLWLLFLSILFSVGAKAQTPTSCSTAATYTYPVNDTVTGYTDSHYWFKVTLDSGNYQIEISKLSGTAIIDSAVVYKGSSCGSLTYLQKDSLGDSTNFYINLYDTTTTTYYVMLHKSGSGGTTFSVNYVSACHIVGDMGYCPGQIIKLAAVVTGTATSPSYTWMPGNLHTSSITLTPTGPVTYTLNYTAAGFSTTSTVSIFPLPASSCKNCEMVQNGSFESYQNTREMATNIAYPTICNPVTTISDPKYWIAPTCGTSDYFNGDFPYPYPGYTGAFPSVSVPKNYATTTLANNTTGGRGYAGFYTFQGWTASAREYIQEPLKCALVPGQLYNVSFYTSAADGLISNACKTNNIGAYLSVLPPSGTGDYYLSATPQANAYGVINNVGSWTQVTGTMVGNGEQYITLGNFYPDSYTQVTNISLSGAAYYFVDDISVTPVPLTLSASSCQSGSITISANGAPSSTLTTWHGPSSYTASGSSITILSPSVATTYTCTVNLSANCPSCTSITQTITIQPASTCSASSNPTYTPTANYSFSAATGYAANNIQINAGISYTINCADLRMAATTSITVASTGTLTIAGSWIHACNECSNTSMWQGIVVNNGGTLITTTSGSGFSVSDNIIEDAVQAVYMSSGTSAPSYTISNVIFNNNSTCIYIDANTADLSANKIYADCIFTCRNLGNHSVNRLLNTSQIRSDILAATPVLHASTANPTDLTIAGARTRYGIYINSVSVAHQVIIGANSSSYSSNIFDNVDIGIYNNASSLTAINNVFQNLTGNSSSSSNPLGTGIYNTGATLCADKPCAVDANIIIGNSSETIVAGETNYFTNCLAGIVTTKCRHLFINNNIFNNEITATTFNTSGTYVAGQYGIYNNKFAFQGGTTAVEQMLSANNNIQNFATGLYLDFGTLNNTAGSISVATNTITATGSATQYCNYGIYTQQSGTFGAASGMPLTGYEINNNLITNIGINCIYASAINNSSATSGFFDIESNTELSLKFNPACTTLQTPRVAAVSLSACWYARVSNNNKIGMTWFWGSGYISSSQYEAGIYVVQSPHSSLNCNTINNLGEDIVFESTSPAYSNSMQQNNFDYSGYGFVLRSSGVIGDQGTTTYSSDNIWGNSPYHFGAQTLCDNSNPGIGTTSILHCRAATCSGSTTFMPCTNSYSGSGSPTPYASGSTLITASGYSTLICTSEGGGGGGERIAGSQNAVFSQNYQDSIKQVLTGMITPGATPLALYDYETHWAMQYFANSTLASVDAIPGYEHAKTLAFADAAFAGGEYGNALTLTNSFSANNVIESNWQAVNNVLIKMQSDTISPGDINNLQQVAAQCHLTGGSIVWKARAILNAYYGTILSFPNACPVSGSGDKIQNASGISTVSGIGQSINLYPNPNNGSMTLEYSLKEDGRMEITDVTGNLVGTYSLPVTGTTVQIKNDNLPSGVYMYRIIGSNTIIKLGKIVIIK